MKKIPIMRETVLLNGIFILGFCYYFVCQFFGVFLYFVKKDTNYTKAPIKTNIGNLPLAGAKMNGKRPSRHTLAPNLVLIAAASDFTLINKILALPKKRKHGSHFS